MVRSIRLRFLLVCLFLLPIACTDVPPETPDLHSPTPPWVGLGRPRTGSIWLLVTNAEGQRVEQVAPYIRRQGSASIELLDDTRPGEMAIYDVEPGVWVVGVQGHGYLLHEVTFDVRAGQVTEGHVVVQPDPAPDPPTLVVHKTGLSEEDAIRVAEAVSQPTGTIITVVGYILDYDDRDAPYMCDGGLPSLPPGCADPYFLTLEGFEWADIKPERSGADRWAYGAIRGEIRHSDTSP